MNYKANDNNTCFYINKDKLIDNFNNFSTIGNVYYPLKANSNKKILKILKPYINNSNNGFLISYMSHYKLLKDLCINPKNICLMNVLSTIDTIKILYNEGVRFFTIDDFTLLKELDKFMKLNELKINIRLSINDVFKSNLSHLGSDKEECLEMINYLKNKCDNVGLSFYLSNNIKKEKKYFEQMIEYVIKHFKNNNLKFISIGGIEPFEDVNIELINRIKKELNLSEIILEPGQNLVGNAIYMETTILRIRNIDDKKIVIIKNGIYSGLFDKILYNKKFDFYFESKEDGQIKISYEKSKEKNCEFHMYGGSSDSGDNLGKMFIEEKYIDEFTKNSKFYVKNVGAYVEEFFMAYGQDLNIKYLNMEEDL